MLLIVFCMALVAGSTQLSTVANFMALSNVGLRVFAWNGGDRAHHGSARGERADFLSTTQPRTWNSPMVHEAMVLEYSGRHLAMIEFGAFLKLLLYISLIACVFLPWKIAVFGTGPWSYVVGAAAIPCQTRGCGLFFSSHCSRPPTAKNESFFAFPQFSWARRSCSACSAHSCCSSQGVF